MLAQGPEPRIRRLVLANDNRRRVYAAIQSHPGTHVRRLARDLGLALGSIEHHLQTLHQHGLVRSHRDGRRRGLYAADHIDPDDIPWLHALARPMQARILAHLAETEDSADGIRRAIGSTEGQTYYHLRRLRDAGLVDRATVGRASLYAVTEAGRLRRLLGQDCMVRLWRRAQVHEDPDPLVAASRP